MKENDKHVLQSIVTRIKGSLSILMLFVFLLASMAWMGCENEEDKIGDDFSFQQNAAIDYASSETYYLSFLKLYLELKASTTLNTQHLDTIWCGVATTDAENTIYNVDFDVVHDTLCLDSRQRSGKIAYDIVGDLTTLGGKVTVTLSNFTSQDKTVTGEVSFSCDSIHNNIPILSVVVEDGYIDFNYDYEYGVSFEMDKFFIWESGSDTPTIDDDSFTIKGAASGRSREFDRYYAVQESDYTWNPTCFYYRSGLTDFQMPDFCVSDGNVDFGGLNGTQIGCDAAVWYAFRGYLPNTNIKIGDSAYATIYY